MPDVPGPACVLRAPRYIDAATAPPLGRQLAVALSRHHEVVLDCTEVRFCDSTALKVLVEARQQARELDAELRIVNAPEGLLRIATIAQALDALGLREPAATDDDLDTGGA